MFQIHRCPWFLFVHLAFEISSEKEVLRLGTLVPMNIEVPTKYPLSQDRIVVFEIRLHSKSPMLYRLALHGNSNASSLARRTRTNSPRQRFHSELFCKIVRYFCRTLQFRVCHLHLCLPKRLLPFIISDRTGVDIWHLPIRAVCPFFSCLPSPFRVSHHLFVSPITFSCLPSPFPVSHHLFLSPITFSSATIDRCSSIRVGDQVSHPNSSTVYGCNRMVHLRQCGLFSFDGLMLASQLMQVKTAGLTSGICNDRSYRVLNQITVSGYEWGLLHVKTFWHLQPIRQAVTLSSNSLNSNLLRNLAAENVRLYRTVFIYCGIVQNSVHILWDCAEQRS